MSSQPQSRQDLYKRIRERSQDEVILQEMIRLGFWPEAGVLPEDPADEIRRRGQLEAQLRALRTEKSRLSDVEAMRREARKRCMAESRKRREETKQRRRQEREERARSWAQQQSEQVVYLGQAVSGGLNNLDGDPERLQRHGVPIFDSPAELAKAMGKRWGQSDDVIAAVEGFANYVAMVDREKGQPLQARAPGAGCPVWQETPAAKAPPRTTGGPCILSPDPRRSTRHRQHRAGYDAEKALVEAVVASVRRFHVVRDPAHVG